jgi:ADP-heptose:LPS heptosyltransferase
MFFNTHTSVSQTYLQLARLLNCHMIYDELYPLQSSSEEIPLSENRVLKFRDEKYIVINPNASDLRIERRWSKENFIALIQKIFTANPEYLIILIGNKKEQSYVNEILLEINDDERIFSLAGKTNLDELISLIKYSSLIITNDTGPMHIAFSTEAKTVSLFGPCAPVQHGHMKNNFTLYKKVYCSPCVHDFSVPPCSGDNQCMKLIGVDEVFDAAQLMLRINTDAMPLNKKDQTIYLADERNVLGKVVR